MAKLQRATQQIFASKAGSNQITAFGTAKSETPDYTSDVTQIQNNNFLYGWSTALLPDNAPWEEDTNGLFYAITRQLAYLFQEGIAEYDPNTEYSQNAIVKGIGDKQLYYSLMGDNKGNPLNNSTYWKVLFSDGTTATYEIGLPQPTFSNNLLANEIWLEGQEVSRSTYENLFNIYGTTYGAGDGSTTFNLPDCRDRVFWGATGFGYIEAGLPNITGTHTAGKNGGWGYGRSATGCFSATRGGLVGMATGGSDNNIVWNFDASGSSPIYGKSKTVQPPGIKVRVKTRFK